MGKSFQKKPPNAFQTIDLGTMQLNLQKMLLHRSIAESIHYPPKKKKNNKSFSLKTYIYKGFINPNHPMQADSSSSERKMANFVQFKITKI